MFQSLKPVASFYRRLSVQAIETTQSTADKWTGLAAFIILVVGAVKPDWSVTMNEWTHLIPVWWSIIPLSLFVLWRMLKTNYDHVIRLEDQVEFKDITGMLAEQLAIGNKLLNAEVTTEQQYNQWREEYGFWTGYVPGALEAYGLNVDATLFETADIHVDTDVYAPYFNVYHKKNAHKCKQLRDNLRKIIETREEERKARLRSSH
jgi:hypothetical protein